MASELALEKGCLYRRKNRPTIYLKFTPRRGGKAIHLSTGKTNFLAAAATAQVLLDTYAGKTPGQVKGQKLTLADFCRIPKTDDSDDRGGQFWQYLVANRAGNMRNRHRDILKTRFSRPSGPFASMTWTRKPLKPGNSAGSAKWSAPRC